MKYFAYQTAVIDKGAVIGADTKIWHHAHIREGVTIGKGCVIGQNVYIDAGVTIGDYCRIQNNCSIYKYSTIGKFVFIGPHVIFTNDTVPRAFNSKGKPNTDQDWNPGSIVVSDYASIGAGSILLPNIMIGEYALVGAGSVVTKNVPSFTLVYGNPAVVRGKVDARGLRIP